MVGSQFDVDNMKDWIHPALYKYKELKAAGESLSSETILGWTLCSHQLLVSALRDFGIF